MPLPSSRRAPALLPGLTLALSPLFAVALVAALTILGAL